MNITKKSEYIIKLTELERQRLFVGCEQAVATLRSAGTDITQPPIQRLVQLRNLLGDIAGDVDFISNGREE